MKPSTQRICMLFAVIAPSWLLMAQSLTFPEAWEKIRHESPALKAKQLLSGAAVSDAKQEAAWPNPELEFEVEELNRGGEGFDAAEMALVLSQEIGAWGHRGALNRLSGLQERAAHLEYQQAVFQHHAEALRAYAACFTEQEGLALARKRVALAEQSSQAVAGHVQAGREPELKQLQAEAELELQRIDLEERSNTLQSTFASLASMWGGEPHGITRVAPVDLPVLAPWPEVEARFHNGPLYQSALLEPGIQSAALQKARAEGRPGLALSAGYQRYEEDGTDAVLFGIGLPLPLFDRNAHGIEAAEQRLAGAEAETKAWQQEMLLQLKAAYDACRIKGRRMQILQERVVPAMEQACEAAQKGYEQGKYDFLEMLDAQRSLFGAQLEHLEARRDYLDAMAEIIEIAGPAVPMEMSDE